MHRIVSMTLRSMFWLFAIDIVDLSLRWRFIKLLICFLKLDDFFRLLFLFLIRSIKNRLFFYLFVMIGLNFFIGLSLITAHFLVFFARTNSFVEKANIQKPQQNG